MCTRLITESWIPCSKKEKTVTFSRDDDLREMKTASCYRIENAMDVYIWDRDCVVGFSATKDIAMDRCFRSHLSIDGKRRDSDFCLSKGLGKRVRDFGTSEPSQKGEL